MERSIRDLLGARVEARDGSIGRVHDVLFEAERWVVRYVVLDTGGWLIGRKVLVSPVSFGRVDWEEHRVFVNLTRAAIEASPDISTEKPVTRGDEQRYFEYYGYEPYWRGLSLWGLGMYPAATAPVIGAAELVGGDPALSSEQRQPHLRSAKDVLGYQVQALDGELGHVHDLLMDRATFEITSLVVDTSRWWLGKHVLITPSDISEVRWDDQLIEVRLSRDMVESSPEYQNPQSA